MREDGDGSSERKGEGKKEEGREGGKLLSALAFFFHVDCPQMWGKKLCEVVHY